MRRRYLARATLVVAVLATVRAHGWQTNVSGTPPPSRPLAIDVDGAGNVLAAGRVKAAGGDDGIVAKLAGFLGNEMWQRTVAGTAANVDQLRAVTHDASDDVVVAGQVTNLGTNGDAVLAKYEPDGTLVWHVEIDGGANAEDDALAVALDGSGDVVVVGQVTPANATTPQFSVLRRAAADGTHVWRTDLAGTPALGRAVVVSGNDVYAAGDIDGKIVAVKISDASGVQQWRTDVPRATTQGDVGRAIAIGGGRVAVAGRMVTDATGNDFAVVAFDAATGAVLWTHLIDGSATDMADNDDAFGVAIDAAGDVVAVGRLSDATQGDNLFLVKLTGATGDEVWRTVVNGNNDNADDGQAVALDAAGDALVVGSVRNRGRGRDMFVGKFANGTGEEQWSFTLNGTASMADIGSVIALSAEGDAVAAGRINNGTEDDGFTVVKLTGANGGNFPCGNGVKDPTEECDDGNVTPGDGCRGDCTIEVCGDGILDPQEQCDDGNTFDGDCCSAACTIEPDQSPCDDGDACTVGDACAAGKCKPAGTIACPVTGQCLDAVCNPADGTCANSPKPNGSACNDGNACTLLDRCVDAVCTSTIAPTCDDHEPCTRDGCDPAVGCVHDALTSFEGVACVLDRQTIADSCGPTVPRPVLGAIERIRGLLMKAATARPRQARQQLRRVGTVVKGALKVTAKYLRQQRVNSGCAGGIDDTLNDLATRASGLRKDLATGS